MKARYLLPAITLGAGLTIALLVLTRPASIVQAGGVTHYVREGGTGITCTVPTDPCGSIQQAIHLASSDGVVWVATGIYTENLVISHGVWLFGGWNTLFTERSPISYPTVIDGGGAAYAISATAGLTPIWIDDFLLRNANDGIHLYGGAGIASQHLGGGYSGTLIMMDNLIYSVFDQAIEVETSTVWIERNVISGTGEEGIKINGGAADIRFNTVRATGGDGIRTNGASSDVLIRGNTVYSAGDDGIDAQGAMVVVAGNVVTGCAGSGIKADNVGNWISIEANRVFGNAAAGIAIRAAQVFTLTNNIVGDHVTASVELSGTGFVYHNTLVGSGTGAQGVGVAVLSPVTITIANNIVVSHSTGITATVGATLSVSNTLLWGNGSDPISGTGAIAKAPAFVAPAQQDYHILPDSPAINAGVPVGVLTDIDGEPRLGAPDVGADEVARRVYLPLVMRSYSLLDLLRNPGFEGITCRIGSVPPECLDNWTRDTHDGHAYPDIYTPQGWVTWWRTGGGYGRPQVGPIPNVPPFTGLPPRIRDGYYALRLFSDYTYAVYDAGVYQVVTGLTPGSMVQLSAYAQEWSCDNDANLGYTCGDPWNMTFQVGVEPNGVADPFAPSVVWSSEQNSPDAYRLIGPVTAQVGASGGVCVFLRSKTKWGYKYQEAYWDDASLIVQSPWAVPLLWETEQPASSLWR
jgi:hypothetical protein